MRRSLVSIDTRASLFAQTKSLYVGAARLFCAAGWQRGGGRPACVVRAGSEDWRGEGCDAASHLVAEILALILVITGVSSRSLQLVVLI